MAQMVVDSYFHPSFVGSLAPMIYFGLFRKLTSISRRSVLGRPWRNHILKQKLGPKPPAS